MAAVMSPLESYSLAQTERPRTEGDWDAAREWLGTVPSQVRPTELQRAVLEGIASSEGCHSSNVRRRPWHEKAPISGSVGPPSEREDVPMRGAAPGRSISPTDQK